MQGRRSFLRSPWHYCGCCGFKRHLDEMKWERGVLKCNQGCQDTMLIGEREAIIQRKLSNLGNEAQPDKKLQQPGSLNATEDIIF